LNKIEKESHIFDFIKKMLDELIVASCFISAIGYGIEIYNLCIYGDNIYTHVCIWSANGMASTVAFVYCYFNQYKSLEILFIIHYAFCFICVALNACFLYMRPRYVVQEEPSLPMSYPSASSFEIESTVMMDNPLHQQPAKKRRGDENV
jgi:hypothetical protein